MGDSKVESRKEGKSPLAEGDNLASADRLPISPAHSGRTVLAVDDDPAILSLIERVLEPQGFRVLRARDSDEAFRISETHQGPIHLLMTDQVMPPYMNGNELAECMRLLRPELEVLYISGYGANPVVQRDVEDEFAFFLPKPFSPVSLLQKVEEVFADRPAPGISPLLDPENLGRSSLRAAAVLLLTAEDAAWRDPVAGHLRQQGYAVLESDSAEAAAGIAKWRQEPIHLWMVVQDEEIPSDLLLDMVTSRPNMRFLTLDGERARSLPLSDLTLLLQKTLG